jgi:hypothetical protein
VKHAFKGVLLIEFSLLTARVHAQSALDIRVTSQQGRALPDAVLTLKHGAIEKHGVTRLDGGFRFLGLPAGEYELLAAADGHFSAEAEIAMRPRQPLSVQIEMVPRQTLSQSVEVRSADISFGEISTSRLLTHSELSALPDTVKRDIPTLSLYTFPGATLSHDNFVHVRGNEVSLQEFINGVSFLENPQQQFSAGLTPDSFETINMVSGSFAAEYGNRFGGILDMTTRSGFDVTGHGSLAASAGSLDTHNAFAEYGGAAGKLGYYVSASGFTSGWYLNPPEPRQLHDFGFGLRGSGQLDYRLPKDSISIFITGGGTNFELPNLDEDQEVGRDSMRRLRSQTTIFTWQHTFSPTMLWSTSIYERTVDDRLVPTTDPVTPFGDGFRTSLSAGIKSDFLRGWRNHTVKAGVDLTRIRLRERFAFDSREDPLPREDPEPFTFLGTAAGGQASAYLQDHISLTGNLSADIGLRWDHFSLTDRFAQVSPRFSVAYHVPRSRSSVHFAYNRLFSPPPLEYVLLANHFGTAAPEPDDRVGNVKPYRQHYFEAGLARELHTRAALEVTGFYHRGTTPFEYREISVTRLFLPINSARGVSYGVETALELKQLERLGISGRLQYAYQRTFFYGPISGGFALGEDIQPGQRFLPAFDEPHSGTATIFYRHRWHDVSAGWMVRYGSGTAAQDGKVRLPSHSTADFSAGLNIWRRENASARLEFNLSNVSDYRYAIAKESEETPIQYASPRLVAGRIKFNF